MNFFSLIFFIAFIAASFISCNNTNNQIAKEKEPNNSTDTTDKLPFTDYCTEDGIGNFIITPGRALKMRGEFLESFKHKGMSNEIPALTESFWIDSCVINFLSNFFDAHPQYDGLRIYNGAYGVKGSNQSVSGQQYDYQSRIMFRITSPVYTENGGLKDTTHKDEDVSYGEFPTNCKEELQRFFLSMSDEKIYKALFNVNHRKAPAAQQDDPMSGSVDSLSLGVWMHKCVFKSLAKAFKDYPKDLDGVLIYNAAYYEKAQTDNRGRKKPKGRKRDIQSTFVIVLSEPKEGKHNENWSIIEKLYKNDKNYKDDAYNHGELCPDLCN